LLVIVDDFHVVAMAIAPDKADAPLIIDSDRVFSRAMFGRTKTGGHGSPFLFICIRANSAA